MILLLFFDPGGTDEAAVRLGHQEEGCPGLHHPDGEFEIAFNMQSVIYILECCN